MPNINLIFYLAAYLIGGIPFGLILAKVFTNIDIRQKGSKAIGATNVLRVVKEKDPALAKKLSIATVILDALKGVIILVIASLVGVSEETKWAIAVISVLGHCFSPYLKFEGGKGVATGFGVLLYMLPLESIVGFLFWFSAAKFIKISSLSSLIGLTALLIASFIIHPDIPTIHTHAPIIMIAVIIFYKHIPNIIRLLKGEEKRVV